jgi:hypothetical protein
LPSPTRLPWIAALAAGATAFGSFARAQSIEPRAFSPAPVGVNFLIASFEEAKGGLSADPAIPLTDARLEATGPILGYARTLDLAGRSAKIDVILPYSRLSGTALFRGAPVGRSVNGFGDPLARLSVTLLGAPAMTPEEFRSYRQDLLVGVSLQVSAPFGQYDPARLLNHGLNRWGFKPEIGVSKAVGPWNLELEGAAILFTANGDFFGGHVRTEEPLYSVQAHVVYNWRSGAWVSVDATWYAGGRTAIDGTSTGDELQNWRLGATLALPVTQRYSIKLYASDGVWARTRNNFSVLGAAWQYRWGGGV